MQTFSMKDDQSDYISHYTSGTMFFVEAMLLADARILEKVNRDNTIQQEERNVLRMQHV